MHCQICGRKQFLRADNTVRLHHVAGDICAGSHYPPIEIDNAWLAEYTARIAAEHAAARRRLAQLVDARANFIPPGLETRIAQLALKARRLARRQRRIETWPARYEDQMRNRGWADVPPAYLLARYREQRIAA
ncbi:MULTISPECIES: hypothetical protein [unclassified Novosphingobium]|uniref:hypothetical protein n=1 Tax=unclassified Novosphingobium TaxID=2644732 RepID=UPI000D4A7C0F|nr:MULTISPECIES: hypothetical protein [unclassified Novosphingobium]PTR07904.1 hypothetical protein C8K11_113115 [Novosphingobium sp. GV055]PUB00717.1 hypothetical protein C8K12_113115 [Novosphingobium sp. GV061]PUB16126.1 hypothetical protein C8K14_113115 [Novosphingobium sp. GV079]PUB39591.1 hypothetical protein C8K10_113115 [Novosphingobium sp. GV027]